jgi:adenosine deaminase
MRRFRVGPWAIAYATVYAVFLVTTSAVALESAVETQSFAAERTAQELERVRAEPLALHDFLKRMPKGADLHSHLSGAIYAETHIRDAIEDELCVDPDAKAFAKSQPVMAGAQLQPVCEENQVPASQLPKNQTPLQRPGRFLLDAGLRAVGRPHRA